jgi:HSP20 family molecular chaperone IbpA
MSTPARSLRSSSQLSNVKPEILYPEEARGFLDEFNDLVAQRAYERFDQDGRVDGNDLAHWLDAESEFESPLPEVMESGDSITVNVLLPRAFGENVKVYATEDRAIVYAENATKELGKGIAGGQRRGATYYMVRWPEIVDPASCAAEMEGGNLTLSVRRTAGHA